MLVAIVAADVAGMRLDAFADAVSWSKAKGGHEAERILR